jgi:prepilin-type N-terminal cleavage/methylation domain-containing protein
MRGFGLMIKRRLISDQRGFTLTELLVGMFAGLILVSGLFTILDVTIHQTTRTFSRVDATQRGRAALEAIENELHSACYANSVTPVVGADKIPGSTANQLVFWTQYGGDINPTPVQHMISFDPTAGTLSDTTYTTTGTAPKWVASATPPPVTKQLLPKVAQSGSTPVFQYYKLTSAGPTAVSSPVSATNANNVADIRITLVVKPADGGNLRSDVAANTVTNQVDLRLTPIPNPSPQTETFNPCQ